MIRIALPTGDLRGDTAAVLDRVGLGLPEYGAGSRSLRFELPEARAVARVFREKDIPVQVAMGNYDIGICGIAWVEELAQRFPRHEVVRLRDLGFDAGELWLAAASDECEPSVRFVSEYANIAESLARRMRLPRYRIFPVWGAAEAYPPEDADVALIFARDAAAVAAMGLRPLHCVLPASAWLIANRRSLATKDMAPVLGKLSQAGASAGSPAQLDAPPKFPLRATRPPRSRDRLRLALPDGHQQVHTIAALQAAGIAIDGYSTHDFVRRPRIAVDCVDVKVIRPQDMTQQVAIGNFDLAVTGRDLLLEHKVQFPDSPVEEVADLRRSRYSLAAIVKDVAADTIAGAVAEWRATDPRRVIRLASERPNIADHFARERHLGRYSVIPIAGASEGFVPDDAEILIEGIETGTTVRANKLTVLERFFESTNCLIANTRRPDGVPRAAFNEIIERMRRGAGEAVAAGQGT
jgi:ATP phosphoribosyltransferase